MAVALFRFGQVSRTCHSLQLVIAVAWVLAPGTVDALDLRQPFSAAGTSGGVTLLPLRRESVPVRRDGVVTAFKTSYSGVINVGSPAQEFRVVFDTGSGHVVLPATECLSESCLMHRQYDIGISDTATAVNADGSVVLPGDLCDQVNIGFGTGDVTGEFVKERTCLGSVVERQRSLRGAEPCVDLHVIMAVEMSAQPFSSFNFDGIVGLGLSSLSLSDQFSFFGVLSASGKFRDPYFAVFLTEGEEESEIAFGGHNTARLLEPLHWTPIPKAELGYWQVSITAVRIDGQTLDICKHGNCRGVVDTGTSHIGIPTPYYDDLNGLLAQPANDLLDCRIAAAPRLEIELQGGINITLGAQNYMRQLPLSDGLVMGSVNKSEQKEPVSGGVAVLTEEERQTHELTWFMDDGPDVKRWCRPKTMPVHIPEPIGPDLFIFGEPVLHRYYTVFDWEGLRVGFGVANNDQNQPGALEAMRGDRGSLPPEVDVLLMQKTVVMNNGEEEAGLEDSSLLQVSSLTVVVVRARRVGKD